MFRAVEWFLMIGAIAILIAFIVIVCNGCTVEADVDGSVAANGELVDFKIKAHPRLFPTTMPEAQQ